MYGKKEIYSFLDEKNIPYEKLEHDAVCTMAEMDAAGITSRGTVCKNLFLRDARGHNHFLVTVPEEKKVDLKDLAEDIGSSRLSFASAERLQKYLAVEQGSVSPLGVLNNQDQSVVVIFDKELKKNEAVGVHPNDNTATIWLKFSDIEKIITEHGNDIVYLPFPVME